MAKSKGWVGDSAGHSRAAKKGWQGRERSSIKQSGASKRRLKRLGKYIGSTISRPIRGQVSYWGKYGTTKKF